ncbi:MAG TPA: hypothetical protein VNM92_12775 [Thermoanaerobaculia bacterium]|nr:hypothetical protein [Thermoanaerobaculia bacterium]
MQANRNNDAGGQQSTPPWVKVFAAIAILIVLLFVLSLLFGGGNHGPGRHKPAGLGELTTSEPVRG